MLSNLESSTDEERHRAYTKCAQLLLGTLSNVAMGFTNNRSFTAESPNTSALDESLRVIHRSEQRCSAYTNLAGSFIREYVFIAHRCKELYEIILRDVRENPSASVLECLSYVRVSSFRHSSH